MPRAKNQPRTEHIGAQLDRLELRIRELDSLAKAILIRQREIEINQRNSDNAILRALRKLTLAVLQPERVMQDKMDFESMKQVTHKTHE